MVQVRRAGRGDRGNVFPDGPNWSVNCAGCGAAPPEGGRHSTCCPLCPSTYFCGGKECPGKPFERHEAWHAQNDQENDGQVADRKAAGEHQQRNRKVAEQQARAAEKSGSEFMRLLADATRHMAEERYRPAEMAFRKAIALDSAQPIGYYNLGCLYSNERRPAEAAHNFVHAATLHSELRHSKESVEWADSITAAFDELLKPECKEVANKVEWWNDESLKALSKTVARVTGAADGDQSRLNGHLMRVKVLSGQHPAWKSGRRSVAELNEAAKHGGLAAQFCFALESKGPAVALLGMAAELFHKAADMEVVEANVKAAKAGAKAVVRAEAETKANAAADVLLAEEAAETAAAGKAHGKSKGKSKGKGKSSGKQ